MANTVDIILRGRNQASQAIQQVRTDLGGLDSAASTLAGGLRGLVGVAGVAGIAALGVAAIHTGAQLGDLGERVRRSEQYFTAFSGSSQLAAANLEAMRRATDGALSTQEAMNAGASIMGMGLAKNAGELEKFARMAVLLGGNTRTATEAINEFQLLIANQSILRLDTFGISGARVRTRIEELQASTKGLSREQAFLDAVMEEGTRKVQQLEAAGVTAGTTQDRLASATKDLKAELGKLVEQPYVVTIEYVTKVAKALTFAASPEGAQQRDYLAKFNDYQAAAMTTAQAQEDLNQAVQRGEQGEIAYARVMLQSAQANEEVALSAYRAAQGIQDVNLNGTQTPAIASNAAASMLDLASAYDRVAAAQGRITPQAQLTANAWYSGSGDFYKAMTDNKIQEDARYAREVRQQRDQRIADEKRAHETSAKTAANAYDTAFKTVSGRIQGYLSQGMNASIGLLDVRKDQFKPGSNGAFENLFRALDVAKLGDASPWAKQLGLTQEDARKISEDFQRGIFSADVMGLVDEGALVKEAQMAALAEKTQAAFAAAIAKKAGVGTNLVSSMFGFDSKAANGTDSQAKQSVDSAMSQVAGTLGDTIKGKDFAGKVIGYGETIWGYFEQGIVKQAQNSSTLQSAIDAMVAKALGSRTGGSVSGAARAGGVN